jgi:hypothetical protein
LKSTYNVKTLDKLCAVYGISLQKYDMRRVIGFKWEY